MSYREQVEAHLREVARSLAVAQHAAKEVGDPAQVIRYIQDMAARTSRARAAADKWRQTDDH